MVIRLHSTLRGESGVREVTVDAPAGTSVTELLVAAAAARPELRPVILDAAGRPRRDVVIFYDGRNIRLQDGLDTALAAGAGLSLFPNTGAQRAFAVD